MACEGRRLAALRDGFGRALEGATGACGFEEFKACYAHVPEAYHATMFDVYCQSVLQLRAMTQSDFDAVCVEGRLGAWLDELDALCAARGVGGMGVDAPATRPALLGALAPADAARGARCAAKAAELDALHAALAEAEASRLTETSLLEAKRAELTAAAVALAPLAEANGELHMAAYVQSLRGGVQLRLDTPTAV